MPNPPKTIFPLDPPVEVAPNEEGQLAVHMDSMAVDTAHMKFPFSFPVVPQVFFAPIGAIIAQWGNFELAHDQTLKILVCYNGTSISLPRSFKKRRDLFRKELYKALPHRGELSTHIEGILDEAAAIYWKRNIIAHGQLVTRIQRNQGVGENFTSDDFTVLIIGFGVHNGKEVKQKFPMVELRSLFYCISNLVGRMREILDQHGPVPGSTLQEVSLLQALRSKH